MSDIYLPRPFFARQSGYSNKKSRYEKNMVGFEDTSASIYEETHTSNATKTIMKLTEKARTHKDDQRSIKLLDGHLVRRKEIEANRVRHDNEDPGPEDNDPTRDI